MMAIGKMFGVRKWWWWRHQNTRKLGDQLCFFCTKFI